MKKIKILVAAILAFFAGNAMAQSITVDNVTVEPNGQANIVVKYGDKQAAAAQFDLVLPEGVTLKGDAVNGDLIPGHTVVKNTLADGSVRYLIYSLSGNQFTNTTGTLLTIPVAVGDVEEGELTGAEIKNVKVANYDAESVGNVADVNVKITVGEPTLKGDVDGDGVVNIADIDAIVNQILHLSEETTSADLNEDGKVNTQDLVEAISIVFPPAASAKANFVAEDAVNELAAKGGTSVTLGLNNTSDFRALQFDLTLPDGLEMSDIQLASSASGMETRSNKIGTNTWRVLIAGLDGQAYIGANAGNIVNIALNGATSGEATISNILFTDVNAIGTEFGNMTLKVQGGTANGIDGINADVDADGNKSIYSVGGASQKSLQRGVNIIRDAAGKVTKVIKR